MLTLGMLSPLTLLLAQTKNIGLLVSLLGSINLERQLFFGAALMFDETCASFTWLFKAFLAAHNGKHPRTIFTDQDSAMGKAVREVFIESWHELCTFHIMQNTAKHLSDSKKDDDKDKKKPHILTEFSACMYDIEDKVAFDEAFDIMINKVDKKKASWLQNIYKFKEQWAECYMRDVLTLGMRSTQLSESFNSDLKDHLKSDLDIIRFLKHFERAVQTKRNKELDEEFEARKKLPRIRMNTPMLVQASKIYTHPIFEAFQTEYERSMAACARPLSGNDTYAVAIVRANGDLSSEQERIVVGDPLEQASSCSCYQFTRTGVLCSHALKVLDLMNIKLLPAHYVLKRWTREAREGNIHDSKGRRIIENPKLDAMIRYRFLSQKSLNLAYEAARSTEYSLLMDDALELFGKQLKDKICTSTNILSESAPQPDVHQDEALLSAARLKKKEVQPRSSKRHRSWLDKTRKYKKKVPNKTTVCC